MPFAWSRVLNQFRKNLDPTLGEKVETVCNRHFYSSFQFLGNISYDELVLESVFSKKFYIHKYGNRDEALAAAAVFRKDKNAERIEHITRR